MNRFVIVEGLPYLYCDGKTYAVRWDEEGFTVGDEINLPQIPAGTFSELSVKAKCEVLCSISADLKAEEKTSSRRSRKKVVK